MRLSDQILDSDWLEGMMNWVLIGCIAAIPALLLAMVWWAYRDSTAEHIALRMDEWTCTSTQTRTYMQPIIVGKVITQQVMTETVCAEYKRR